MNYNLTIKNIRRSVIDSNLVKYWGKKEPSLFIAKRWQQNHSVRMPATLKNPHMPPVFSVTSFLTAMFPSHKEISSIQASSTEPTTMAETDARVTLVAATAP